MMDNDNFCNIALNGDAKRCEHMYKYKFPSERENTKHTQWRFSLLKIGTVATTTILKCTQLDKI